MERPPAGHVLNIPTDELPNQSGIATPKGEVPVEQLVRWTLQRYLQSRLVPPAADWGMQDVFERNVRSAEVPKVEPAQHDARGAPFTPLSTWEGMQEVPSDLRPTDTLIWGMRPGSFNSFGFNAPATMSPHALPPTALQPQNLKEEDSGGRLDDKDTPRKYPEFE